MELKLTDLQLDALREIGTIGAGNAATGLSKMLNKRIGISVPSTKVVKLEKVPELLGGAELLVAAVYFQVTGPFMGSIFLIFPLKEALRLVDMLLGKKSGETQTLDEFAGSALKELGNISAGSYLMALSSVVKMRLMHSIPGLAVDMLESVLDGVLIKLAQEAENALVIDTEFKVEENKSPHLPTEHWTSREGFENSLHPCSKTAGYSGRWGDKVRGHFLFLPEPEGLSAILKELGVGR